MKRVPTLSLLTFLFISMNPVAAQTVPAVLESRIGVSRGGSGFLVGSQRNILAVSPDGSSVAYLDYDPQRRKDMLYLNTAPVTAQYDSVTSAGFSPDSRRLAAVVALGSKELVLLDGVHGKSYDAIEHSSFLVDISFLSGSGKGSPIVFSADGRRTGFVARSGSTRRFVVDGLEGPEVDDIAANNAPLRFSPDSSRYLYGAKKNMQEVVVTDGQAGRRYDVVVNPQFSPDSKRVMYWAKRAGKWVVVTNDAESAEYDGVHAWLFHFVFSPDGHRVAYFPIRGNQELLVLDGREIVHSRGLINPVWSPDSSKLAYIVQGAVTRVGVNGVEENEAWDRVDSISFSPDSRRLAYVGTRAGRQHLVVDKQTGPPVDGIDVTSVRFKPDSSGLIYVEKRGGRVVVVDGGKASAAYDEITELTVSPDSRQIAFFGRAASSWYFVRDGVVSAPYDARYDAVRAESLQFSKDSKHFWYVIRQAGTDSVVVNDMSVPSYSEVLTMPTLVEKRLRYLGVRSGVIYYVEVALDVQGRPTR